MKPHKKSTRLRLVSDAGVQASEPEPSIHDAMVTGDDLEEALSDRAATAKSRRSRETKTFARIPYEHGLELYRHIGGAPWAVLIELDRMILAQRGKNPVLFWSERLYAMGLIAHARAKALRQLEAAGVVKIEGRGRGLSPWVTHLWYPRQE